MRQEAAMCQKTFSLIAAVVFLLITLGHLLRVVLGATFVVEGVSVPMWASVLAIILMGYLAFEGFRLWKRSRAGT
jgi:hypothetical protein